MSETDRAHTPQRVFGRMGLIAIVQQASFLFIEYFSAHWPGAQATAETLVQANLVIAWSPVAFVYALVLSALVCLPEALTLRRRATSIKNMEDARLGCLFSPPSVLTLGAFSLFLWWSDLFGHSVIVRATGDDPALLLAIGLTMGSLIWGTVILLIGLVARAVALRIFPH